jgi:hypothetical protein
MNLTGLLPAAKHCRKAEPRPLGRGASPKFVFLPYHPNMLFLIFHKLMPYEIDNAIDLHQQQEVAHSCHSFIQQ